MNEHEHPAEPMDFDHNSADYKARWPEIYQTMRAGCPVLKSRHHDEFWVLSRYDDVALVARSAEIFSSGRWTDENGALQGGISIPSLEFRIIPDESDKPQWTGYRDILNRLLGPQAVEQRRARAEAFATALIDKVIETGHLDLVWDLANPLPALVTMELLGLPIEQWREFSEPYHGVNAAAGSETRAEALKGIGWVSRELERVIALRRKAPADDLISNVVHASPEGQPLSHQEIIDILIQVIGGGVDTTTGLTANAFMHLHRNHADRQRLIDQPEIIPKAREEFVRFFTPVMTTARTVLQDVEIAGQTMRAGERVLVPYCAANRDPGVFETPEEIVLDRFPNRHIGFGAGMHRCVGSNLARMMFETMLQVVLTRMPDYVIDEQAAEQYERLPVVNGWMTMPARFTPGRRIGPAGILP